MITVDIRPAKQRFSRRKQWKFSITAANGEPIDPRDTYANPADITTIMQKFRWDDVQVRIHYEDGISSFQVPAKRPF